jgi:hypothetical protein
VPVRGPGAKKGEPVSDLIGSTDQSQKKQDGKMLTWNLDLLQQVLKLLTGNLGLVLREQEACLKDPGVHPLL